MSSELAWRGTWRGSLLQVELAGFDARLRLRVAGELAQDLVDLSLHLRNGALGFGIVDGCAEH